MIPVIPATVTLSGLFAACRREAGLSYDHLAVLSGVSVAYLHSIERGIRHPSRDVLIRIAFGLRLNLEAANDLIVAGGHFPLIPVHGGNGNGHL